MPAPIRLMVFEGYQPGYGFFNAFGALTRPLLKRGSTGPAVVEAQKKLMEILQRSFRYGADGQFGDETDKAVREVQALYLVQKPVTGVIDADTWTLLLGQEVTIGTAPVPGTPPMLTPPSFPPVSPPGSTPPGVPPPVDITVGGKEEKSNMGLYVGLGLAALAAVFLLRKKKDQ